MPALFQTVAGRLVQFDLGDSVIPFSIGLDRVLAAGFVTSVSVSEEVTAQVATALDNSVHITPFGDKPAQINIGVLLNDTCAEDQVVKQFLNGYRDNKLSQQNPEALTITIGGVAYQVIVIGHNLTAQGGNQMLLGGTLRLLGWAV